MINTFSIAKIEIKIEYDKLLAKKTANSMFFSSLYLYKTVNLREKFKSI